MKRTLMAVLAPALLGGCLLVVEPRHRTVPPPTRTQVTYTYSASWHDTRFVLWREYYGCSDSDVFYLDSLNGYDDLDLLAVVFTARHARVSLRDAISEYVRCGRNLFALALHFRLTGDEFFCREVPQGSYCPPPYGNAYGYWWKQERRTLTNADIHALISLRIGLHYYGFSPAVYFQKHEEQKGNPHPFKVIALGHYKNAGNGGRDCTAGAIRKAPDRPWEASNREDWERKRQEAKDKHEGVERKGPPVKIEPPGKVRDDAAERRKEAEEKRRAAMEEERRRAADRKEEPKKKEDAPARKEEPKKEPPPRSEEKKKEEPKKEPPPRSEEKKKEEPKKEPPPRSEEKKKEEPKKEPPPKSEEKKKEEPKSEDKGKGSDKK